MNETLFEVAGLSVTVTGVCASFSVLVLILFMSLWLYGRKKKTGVPIFAGQVMNGIGFGLLPALAVLKAFQIMSGDIGAKVFEPLTTLKWVTENGCFLPCRIEMCAAILGFLLFCLWLIVRKTDMPDNGDLLMISVCIWAAIRMITENMRSEPRDLFRYASACTMMACMIIWEVRRARSFRVPGRTIADLTAAGICIGIHLVAVKGLLTAGSEIGDFAVKTGSALLLLLLILMVGGDVRKSLRPERS